jgi:eukaryotic-like serine/threonine-protein kinase
MHDLGCREIQLRVVDGIADAQDRSHILECQDCRAFAGFAREIPCLLDVDSDESPRPPERPVGVGAADPWSADPARYVLGDVLVRGGMGRIRTAWDRHLDRAVAIKELRHRAAHAERRFLREALFTARLQHPAVVPVYEAGRWPDGRPFYVMKLVAGRSLDAVIAEARSLEERLALLPNAITVAEAVAYAHNQGIVHRDLKPGNVLVGPFGETVVIDWGLAKDVAASGADESGAERAVVADGLTVDGAVLGTPAYMPPEQARGEPVDERGDVYALGALLYHLLAGRPPYQGTSDEALRGVLEGPPPPLERLESRAPSDLATIVSKAMARDPGDRFASAKEIADQLTRWQTGQLVSVHRYSPRALVARFLRRHRTAVAAGIAGLLAVAVTGTLGVRRIVREKEVARRITHELMVEQGRHELLSGRPERALAVLREVYAAGHHTPVLGLLFARLTAVLPLATLQGDGELTSAAFSPDGRYVAAATRRGTVHVWEAAGARAVRTFRLEDCAVTSVAFRPDGAWLLVASDEGRAVAWDLASGAAAATFRGHRSGVRAANWHADGTRVVTAGADGAVRVWEASSGRMLQELVGHRAEVSWAAYSPDGSHIVTASRDGTARVWDAAGGVERLRLPHDPHATFAAYSPDGSRIVTTGSMRPVVDVRVLYAHEYPVFVWDARTGARMGELVGHRDQVLSVAYDAEGRRIVTASEDESARIWDVRTSSPAAILGGHTKAVRAAVFSPGGDRILTASHDRSARLWDVGGQLRFSSLEVSSAELTSAAYSPDGRWAVVAGKDGAVRVLDPARRVTERILEHPREATFAAFTADGARVLTGGGDGTARVWDAGSGEPLSHFRFGGLDGRLLDYDRERERVLTSAAGKATVWDVMRGERRVAFAVPGVAAGAFRPDGRRVVTASAESAVEIWDVLTGGKLGSLPRQHGIVFQVRYSPDGTRIATGGWDETVRVWDAESGALLASLAGHRKGIRALAFSPDGAFIATGSGDRSVKVWDAGTGHLLASFDGHLGDVLSVAYSPDGAHLLSVGGDGRANVWDVHLADAREIARLARRPVPWVLANGRLLAHPSAAGPNVKMPVSP